MKFRTLTFVSLMATRATLGCGFGDAPRPADVHGTLSPGAAAKVVSKAQQLAHARGAPPASETSRWN